MSVYMIHSPSAGAVKIGFSKSPGFRMATHQCGNSEKLELLRILPGGRDVERELHRRFAGQRLFGEWFRFSEDMLTVQPTTASEPRGLTSDEINDRVLAAVQATYKSDRDRLVGDAGVTSATADNWLAGRSAVSSHSMLNMMRENKEFAARISGVMDEMRVARDQARLMQVPA